MQCGTVHIVVETNRNGNCRFLVFYVIETLMAQCGWCNCCRSQWPARRLEDMLS
jgi:hypothetical protein